MKKVIVALILTISFVSYGRVAPENDRHIVLPNPKLLGCRASACSQLWPEDASPNAVYPRQVIVDIFGDAPCTLGLAALYEKSVSMEDLKAEIDKQYGQWALPDNATLPVKLWRVEPEKFAIQLAVTGVQRMKATREERSAAAMAQAIDPRKRSNVTEGGMAQVIYIAFTNKACETK